MFKSIANTFKRNHKIEIAMDLAGKSFGIYPKKLTEQMPLGMRQDWRKEMSDAAQAMDLNNHEFSAMLVIAFIGSIQDRHHKDLIETVMLHWLENDIIRPEIYEHYRDERNNIL
ncbi:hypothetical protein CJF43_17290 [Pseudomonas fragi]|jgi:hypothetical protein|uniref:Uncharacterized protein n=1 Tax=Pseudomonas fragi TaxID=296 RepID=A0A266LRB3_PSEFR|nr:MULTISPECIES: hypothetical protein [Pseudomonas]MQT34248.1 hypothetical protein [Pseudomonas helleri]OZY40591.1 hypothetical protein CJF43_17290 [Pseudomonas fragi]